MTWANTSRNAAFPRGKKASRQKSRGDWMGVLHSRNSHSRAVATALRALGFATAIILGGAIGHDAAAQGASQSAPQAAPKMFFEGDMVLAQACVLNNRFRRNEGVVWRVRVLDATT